MYVYPLVAVLAASAWLAAGVPAQLRPTQPRPTQPRTGIPQPALAPIEAVMVEFMTRRSIPGGALAITYRSRLVYDRGFGYADLGENGGAKVEVTPHMRFRIASLSKPFTAVAVLQLVEAGKLRLTDKVFDLLQPKPFAGRKPENDDFKRVTILQLLQHRGGWARNVRFDPMFRSDIIAAEAGHHRPAAADDIIRYMAGRGLDFTPGKYYSYSNFGYCLLGRVIEKVTGATYEQYVRRQVMAPLGIEHMALGRSKRADRLAGEVLYYGQAHRVARSVFDPRGARVPWPYGGFYLEAMDSHGAWIANARDLLRFARDFDDHKQSKLLNEASVRTMFGRPPGAAGYDEQSRPRSRYYGCGWMIQAAGPVGTQEHGGSLPGTTTKLRRRSDGINWVVLFNTRRDRKGRRIHPDEILKAMQSAISGIEQWPAVDLFGGWEPHRTGR